MRMRGIHLKLAIFVFGIAFFVKGEIEKKNIIPSRDSLIENLENGLKYMLENSEDLNLDAYFGVLLAYVQLNAVKGSDVKNALLLSENILKQYFKNGSVAPDNVFLKIIEKHLMVPHKWKFTTNKSNKTLSCEIGDFENLNLQYFGNEIETLLFSESSPNEFSSDLCLSELVSNKGKKLKLCRISKYCEGIMTMGTSYGYSTAHRLFYWLVCRAEGCSRCKGISIERVTSALCCRLMREASLIRAAHFPEPLRDLFMEQIILCSMSGYKAREDWIGVALSWQNAKGCWGHYDDRRKRSTNALGPEKCSSHMTGLGVALIGMAVNDVQF